MALFDWIVVGLFSLGLVVTMLYVSRLNRSVADFVAANRCAGRYLICVAEGAAAVGIISFLGHFEQYYEGGFSPAFWWLMITPVYLFITMSGWIIYRFRSTRAFTYAQFYEMRYSRNFRVFAGAAGFLAMLVLYGVCPGIAARFVMTFGGLPATWAMFGVEFPVYQSVMLVVIALPLFITMVGGQITVMVTDFLQGQVVQITLLAVTFFLLWFVDWNHVSETMLAGTSTGSLVNPFKTASTQDFNALYFFLWIGFAFYAFGMSPTSQGYQASALNAHESQMARVWSILRNIIMVSLPFFIPIAVYTILHHPAYSDLAGDLNQTLSAITDDQQRSQARIPVVLTAILPDGLRGLFLVCALAAALTTDSTFMQSLGTVFTQDILLPLRGRHLKPRNHMRVLRGSMLAVGLVAFAFSLFFPQNDFLMMFLIAAMGIYLAGAGIVTIGGLYWRKGSTLAAWAAMATGFVLSITFLFLKAVNPDFPLNGMKATCVSALCATILYVAISLWRPANYNISSLFSEGTESAEQQVWWKNLFKQMIALPAGFTSLQDKIVGYAVRVLAFGMLGTFFTVSILNSIHPLEDGWWMTFWRGYLFFILIAASVVGSVLLVGGIIDFRKLIVRLRMVNRDENDDGFVEK